MDTKNTLYTRAKQLQPLYTKFDPITPARSRLRSKNPPAYPFLTRIRYFYGHVEHPMSDIIDHGYKITLNTRAKQLQPLYTKFDPITPPRSQLRSKKPPA